MRFLIPYSGNPQYGIEIDFAFGPMLVNSLMTIDRLEETNKHELTHPFVLKDVCAECFEL